MKWAALLLLAATDGAGAQLRPVPAAGDPRLQTVRYDPDQVVTLSVAEGYQLMIAFDGGERVETVALGNSSFWQATANKRGDVVFVKNLNAATVTNMTVVTDARTYSFDLVPAASVADAPYVVRFTYKTPVAITEQSAMPTSRFRYRVAGAKALRPSTVSSDGTRVALTWPDRVALPAIFGMDDDGQESLVNGEMRDGAFVIPGTPVKLVFRLDRQVATATRVAIRESRRRDMHP